MNNVIFWIDIIKLETGYYLFLNIYQYVAVL